LTIFAWQPWVLSNGVRRILGLQGKTVHQIARLIFSLHLIDHLWGVAGHATNLVSCMAAELNTV